MSAAVHFECLTCGWLAHVAPSSIVIVGGVPTSTVVPFHECAGGADLVERGSWDTYIATRHHPTTLTLKL